MVIHGGTGLQSFFCVDTTSADYRALALLRSENPVTVSVEYKGKQMIVTTKDADPSLTIHRGTATSMSVNGGKPVKLGSAPTVKPFAAK